MGEGIALGVVADSHSRRAVLSGVGAALGCAVLGSRDVRARTTTKAVIADGDETENDMTGFFVHVGDSTSPTEAQVATDCSFADWEADTVAYDVTLVDRADPEYAEYERTVYVPDTTDIPPGSLFVVNSQERCTDGYVGVRLERLGSDQLEAALSGDIDTAAADGSSASGPGFGVVGALAALVGWGALSDRS